MAYGTEAKVLFYSNLSAAASAGMFTSANIALAIAAADIEVDIINSSASSTIKTEASSLVASDILFNRQALSLTGGLASSGGSNGEPGASVGLRKIPSDQAKNMLRRAMSYIEESNEL
jgi:hypothetical protein